MAPTPAERRRGRLSFRAQAHEAWVRKKTRRWHAIVAGAIAGGLGILFEKKGRRVVISQQLFVRGLQGSYNAFTTRRGIRVPHGDTMVFALACGQIMYAFLLRPDTIPRSYSSWIQNASKVPAEAIRMNNSLIREGNFDLADVQKLISRDTTSPENRNALTALLSAAQSGNFGPPFAPCTAVHPWMDRCTSVPLDRFLAVFRWILPIYGAIHFIPMVLFKRVQFLERPTSMLMRAGWGTARSAAFLGTFVTIYQSYFCLKHGVHRALTARSMPIKIPKAFVNLFISKGSFWLGGLLSGLSLFVEDKRRRGELAMYVLPKGLESAWTMARGKGYVFRTGQYGEGLLCAIGMGMVMSTYQNDPQHLSGLVRRILYQFIGPN